MKKTLFYFGNDDVCDVCDMCEVRTEGLDIIINDADAITANVLKKIG